MECIIFVNEVIRDLEEQELYRVLWVSEDQAGGYWIRLNNCRMPERFECAWLAEGIQAGRFEKQDRNVPERLERADASEISKRRRDELWEALESALTDEPDIYDKKRRRELLQEPARKLGTPYNNLYRYLVKYWTKGKTPNAFLPDYRNCGKKTEAGVERKKNGRPARHAGCFGKALDDRDIKNFSKAVKKYYLSRKKATLVSAYEKMLADNYAVASETDPDKLELFPADQIPSLRQFRYWCQKSFDIKTVKQKRDGSVKFELTGRAVTGRSDYKIMGPGAKYQIDATVGDIYLVSQFDRHSIIGRPVIYFIMDCYSRMVTGMYVGLEGPSWAGAMMAIENAASDKVAYCASYGINISEDEWPCHYIPAAILGDRGEMESRSADNLVQMLGIRIENAPPYRADLKGIIEQHFRTVNTNTSPFLPGKVLPDMSERGGHDYRLDARLDIRQFTEIIIRCVLYYNNSHSMDYYEKNEQMMKAGVDAVPLEIWNFGIRYCSGSLRSVSKDLLRLALMPVDRATVTERGVRFKGLYYSCKEAFQNLWFEKARAKGAYKVKVFYDSRDMGAILVEDPKSAEMTVCELVDWETKYKGKQLGEIWYEQEKEKLRKKTLKTKEVEAKINLGKQIETIVGSAEKMTDGSRGESKAERTRGIRSNRRNERDEIRRQEAFVKKEDGTAQIVSVAEEQELEISPIMQLIQQHVEEEIKDDALYSQSRISGTGSSGIPGESAD